MKAFFSLCLCAMMAGNATAQTTNNDEKAKPAESSYVICNNPDTPAHFEGGERAVNNFIKVNMKYPYQAQREAVEGTVIVSYIINEDGLADEVEAIEYNGIKPTKDKGIAQLALENLLKEYPKLKTKAQRQYTEAVQSLLVEAVRLVFNLPKATPAMKDGKPVSIKCTIPVEFEHKEKHI